jgi:hypothetical protein
MLTGRLGNFLVPAALLLFVTGLLVLGLYHWDYPSNVIMFPLVIGTLIVFCTIWLFIRALTAPVDVLSAEGEPMGKSEDPRCGLMQRLMWVAGVYPLVYVLGFMPGMMLYTLAYTSYHRLPWPQRLIAAAIVFVLVYICFYKLMGVTSLPITPLWMRN